MRSSLLTSHEHGTPPKWLMVKAPIQLSAKSADWLQGSWHSLELEMAMHSGEVVQMGAWRLRRLEAGPGVHRSVLLSKLGGGVRDAVRDAPERRLYPINNPLREGVGPLVYRLVGDSDRLGSAGGCATEKLDGLVFEHGELNHSSGRSATIVFARRAMVRTMVEDGEFKDRLAQAMKHGQIGVHDLAKALGISYTAVKKLLGGGSTAMTAANNAKAARLMNVSSDWLAIGDGPMTREVLSDDERDVIVGMRAAKAARTEGTNVTELRVERRAQDLRRISNPGASGWPTRRAADQKKGGA